MEPKHIDIDETIHVESLPDSPSAVRVTSDTETEVENTNEDEEEDEKQMARFAKMLSMSIAYSANIGGTATLTGTPTNLLVAQQANQSVLARTILLMRKSTSDACL